MSELARVEDLQLQINANPDQSVLWMELAALLQKLSHPAAHHAWQNAVRCAGNDANVIGRYGQYLATDSAFVAEAEAALGTALKIEPNHPQNLRALASLLADEDEAPLARKAFEQALAAAPTDAECLAEYAEFLSSLEDPTAEAIFERAVACDPANAAVRCNFANFVWSNRNDASRARAMYQNALKLEPTNAAVAGDFALFLEEIEEFKEANVLFQQSVGGATQDVTRMVNYGSFLSDRCRYDEAHRLYTAAAQAGADDPTLYYNWACMHAKQGHIEPALAVLDKAVIDLGMEDPDFDDADLDNLRHCPQFCELVWAYHCD